ncbi:MAG: radical SAM protein [Candidatus Bathyarchaeia archaeon]
MNDEFPEALQIEVTNKCNFKCQMCIRRVWNAKPLDMDMALYRKIAKTSFSELKRLILYGFGEPFIHPQFIEMLRLARENLPKDGEIIISTNGSLITTQTACKIMKVGVDSVSFSVDTVNEAKLSRLREGSDFGLIVDNIGKLAKIRNKAVREFRLGLETVIVEDNFLELPKLVEFAADRNIDYIFVSHVMPYTTEICTKAMYLTLSKPVVEILKPSLEYGWRLIWKSTIELFGKAYGVEMETASTQLIRSFWDKAEKEGYWINLPLFLGSKDKLEALNLLEEVFLKSKKIAHAYQIDLQLPNLYPDAKERRCPYIERKTLAIRSDGAASPCQEFMYAHPVYINAHRKSIHEVVFGNLAEEGVEEIWRLGAYVNFRDIRRDLVRNMPWCGDCPYSTQGCFYTKTNNVDCFANSPTCNECLYSVNLTQCNI